MRDLFPTLKMRSALPSHLTLYMRSNSTQLQYCNEKKCNSKLEFLPNTDYTFSQVFDLEAAGSQAAKKVKALPETLTKQSPSIALGNLGRKEQVLFLVLHVDDIHVGVHQPTEVIEALKELFSRPGGDERWEVVGPPSTG